MLSGDTIALLTSLIAGSAGLEGLGVLWDNGSVLTQVGGGFEGADVSALQTSLGGLSLGYGAALNHGQRVADDFTLSEPVTITTLSFYAYQTNSSLDSTMTAVYARIWDGPPDDPQSSVVWGDTTVFPQTNLISDTLWTGIYRASDIDVLNPTRPIMLVTADVGKVELGPGDYWLEWAFDGDFALIGPLVPPVTYEGQPGSGNALRFQPKGFFWEPLIDGGPAGWPDDLPFVIHGIASGPAGDLDGNSLVDGQDLLILLNAWGDQDSPADLDNSGLVSGGDLLILLNNWG